MSAMYVPSHFAQTDPAVIAQFLRENSFAQLVSARDGVPEVSHVPLLFDEQSGSEELAPNHPGILWGHLARANDHWRRLAGPVLAVFSGPHAYISPAWYRAEQVVPTWNYATVHIRGELSLIDSLDDSLEVLRRQVEFYETPRPDPWRFDTTVDWSRRLAAGIVAFRIEITSIEAKWKLSQNQPAERCERVIAALEQQGDEQSLAIAAAVAQWARPI